MQLYYFYYCTGATILLIPFVALVRAIGTGCTDFIFFVLFFNSTGAAILLIPFVAVMIAIGTGYIPLDYVR